jgi:hypothetical protein
MPIASMSKGPAAGAPSRRPGLVVAAAVTLASLGLFILLNDMSEHGLRAGPAIFCGLLFLAAVGLVWGGRMGYWFGFAMAMLLGTLFTLAMVGGRLEVGSLVAIGIGLTPLALLLAALRRSPRPVAGWQPPVDPEPAPAGGQPLTLAWPQGWTRPLARGWVMLSLMLAAAVAVPPVGLAMVASGRGADRWVGVSVTLFGLALVGATPLLRPVTRRGNARLSLETVDLGHRRERGVQFPYSRLRMASAFLGGGAMALAMAATIPGTAGFADHPGQPPLWPRILGGLGIVLFVLVVYAGARRGIGRCWRIVLTPSAVAFAQGDALTVVPWEAVDEVRALETTVYAKGFAIHEPYVGLILSDPEAVTTGRFQRALMRISRQLGADLGFPVRPLYGDPVLLYAALRYHHLHPQARDELGTEAGLASLRRAPSAETRALVSA